jgi:hypothetical protein
MKNDLRLVAAYAGLATVCLVGLAACGGSGGDSGPNAGLTPEQIEDRDASASIEGLLGFARNQLARADADSAEPRPLDGLALPENDSADPMAL